MKLPRVAVWVYLAGMIPLGVFYEQVKLASGGTWRFVLVALAYLLALRLIAELLEYAVKRARRASEHPRVTPNPSLSPRPTTAGRLARAARWFMLHHAGKPPCRSGRG